MDPSVMRRMRAHFDELVRLAPHARAHRLEEIGQLEPELRPLLDELLIGDEEIAAADRANPTADAPLINRAGLPLSISLSDPDDPLLAEGAVVDRYQVRGHLGSGGAADVYEVEHLTLGTIHALKVLHHPTPGLRARLVAEGRIQARLRHPHLVRVTDVVPIPGGLGLVMDRVDGPDLSQLIAAGTLSQSEAIFLASGVLAGVAAAHGAGLVHRDIKPANILVETVDGQLIPRVADFGVARGPTSTLQGGTATGMAMGTPGAMAPEQYRDARRANPASDVFSLGALLYELLSGVKPFAGGDLIDLFEQASSADFRPLRAWVPELSPAAEEVVVRALQPDPEDRFPDAGAMLIAWRAATVDATSESNAPASQGSDPSFRKATRALLLTDVVDSTALAEQIGDQGAAEMWAAHDRVARDLLRALRGREIDKTDGFLFLFHDVPAAVTYASAYHMALEALSARLGLRIAARVGLHLGSVMLRENSPADVARGAKPLEVEGLAKPTAARVMSVAIGGQTLLTAEARAALEGSDHPLLSHGWWRLKGLDAPIELFEIGRPGAPMMPPTDGAKVYRVVQASGHWRPARELPHNLPPEVLSSFGREDELRALAQAFREGARLVTLLGPGGTGKTHLARRYASRWMGETPGGVWFCDLSEARSALGVARALGSALDVPLDAGEPFEVLGESLSGREDTLLILDNMEQLIDLVDQTIAPLMAAAPRVRWLATSRHRLGLRGEKLLPLDPLPLPGGGPLQENPAVALFVDRARAVSPRFDLEEAGPDVVARLVELLDGLPLAIELAAARVRVLPPRRILERMGRRFDLLRSQRGAGRQGTLRAAIDWSWDLLEDAERATFARCALFEGGFDLEAAEAILELEGWPDPPWPTDLVESLVDKSLVRATPEGDGVRFTLLRHLQEYALERLADAASARSPDGAPATGPAIQASLEARHAEFYAAWGEDPALERLHGPEARAERRRLELDLDNVVAAVRRAAAAGAGATAARAARGALALLGTTGPFSLAERVAEEALAVAPPLASLDLQITLGVVRTRAGRFEEARAPLEAALAAARAAGAPRLEAAAQIALAHGHLLHGALDPARRGFEAALAHTRAAQNKRGEAECLRELAHVIGIRGGRLDEARPLIEQARALHAQGVDVASSALTESHAGAIASIQGDLDASRQAYGRSRTLAREVGDRRTEGLAEGMLGMVCMLQDSLVEAGPHYQRALELQRKIGDRVHEAITAFNFGELLVRQGETAAAQASFERSAALARANGDPLVEGSALGWLGKIEAERDPARGLAVLEEAEKRLATAGDPIELAKLRCKMGEVALSVGDPGLARLHLHRVQATLSELSLDEDAELPAAAGALARALELLGAG